MSMGAKAAGAYLWELREATRPKMSRETAAKRLDTGRSQIERIEYGTGDTLAPMYMAFVRLVGGDWDEVTDLLLSKTATEEDGKIKAKERLEKRAKAITDRVPDADVPDAIAWVQSLRGNPDALRELRRLLNDSDASYRSIPTAPHCAGERQPTPHRGAASS